MKQRLRGGLARWEDKEHAKYFLSGAFLVFCFWIAAILAQW